MSTRQTIAALGVAAAIAGLGGAAIYAATETQGMDHGGPPGHGGPPPGMAGPPRDDVDSATVHGETVLADGNGGYTTTLTQNGTITELSAASITVRSNDGFSQTYTLPAAAKPPFAVNDTVLIRATRTGATATVTSIGEPLQTK